MEAYVDQLVPSGDHTIVILRLTDLTIHVDTAPLVFHRSAFRQLVTDG
jgi:flavin reductase (DIM6/NTAB) family NADH-FMN oxidoreductase RutF